MIKYLVFILITGIISACTNNVHDLPKINSKNASLLNTELAANYLRKGEKIRAKQKLLKALSLDPDSSKANALMGFFMEEVGELDNARFYYKKAIILAPKSGAELNSYAMFLCRLKDYKNAETYFMKALKDIKYEGTAGIYENAGVCALENKNYTKAKFYFLKAWSHDPSKILSLYELVSIVESEKNYFKALEYLNKNKLNNKELLTLAIDIADKAGEDKLKSQYNNELQHLIKVANNGYNPDFG